MLMDVNTIYVDIHRHIRWTCREGRLASECSVALPPRPGRLAAWGEVPPSRASRPSIDLDRSLLAGRSVSACYPPGPCVPEVSGETRIEGSGAVRESGGPEGIRRRMGSNPRYSGLAGWSHAYVGLPGSPGGQDQIGALYDPLTVTVSDDKE
jgi:hypothetical protein